MTPGADPAGAADVAALVRDLNHPDLPVRYAAANALGKLGPAAAPAVQALIDADLRSDDWGAPYARAIRCIGAPAVPALLKAIKRSARAPEEAGADARPPRPAEEGPGPARHRLPDWYKLIQTLALFWEVGLPAMIELMRHPHPEIRAYATGSVWHQGDGPPPLDEADIPAYLKAMEDDPLSEPRPRKIAEAAIPNFLKALEDPFISVREEAALALAEHLLYPEAVVPALNRLAREVVETEPFPPVFQEELLEAIEGHLRRYREADGDRGGPTAPPV
jgi:HEAT repeat protein